MADTLSDALSKTMKSNIVKQTNEIHDALIVNHPRVQVEEEVFVAYFLPYFIKPEALAEHPAVIAQWIGIAGTPMAEVDVIDIDETVLYTVPSLFDTNIINSAERKPGDSIADISAEFDLRNTNIPAIAQTFLRTQLERKLSIVDRKVNDKAHRQWQTIFERYNLVPASQKAAVRDNPADDLEYD